MKKLILPLLLFTLPAIAADEDHTKLLADLSARITQLEEENRELYGKLEELEYQIKTISSNSSDLKNRQKYYVSEPGDANSEYVIRLDKTKTQEVGEIPFDKAAKSEEEAAFNEAFAYIGKQEFEEAKKQLKDFADKNPNSKYAAQAYFWLGELAIKEKDQKSAAINYLKSYKSNPVGKRAPEALLKLSQSLSELNKIEDACKNLARFVSEFPNAHTDLIEKAKASNAKLECDKPKD